MKFVIVFATFCAIALAAPPQNDQKYVEIKEQNVDVGPESFAYNYATSDGTAAQVQGHLNNLGSEKEALAVSGNYQFVADDGKLYSISYVADENGFQPQGDHIPQV